MLGNLSELTYYCIEIVDDRDKGAERFTRVEVNSLEEAEHIADTEAIFGHRAVVYKVEAILVKERIESVP